MLKYFQVWELVDQNTYEQMGVGALSLFNPQILIALDNVREYFGKRVTVNTWHEGGQFQWRGYRTVEAAHKLGSPTGHEQHQAGNAFDFDVQGLSAEAVRQKIKADQDNPLLLNIMRLEANVSCVHMDGKNLVFPEKRVYEFIA
jgi:hypothetical protein